MVEFSPADFGLEPRQQLKLLKLAGARYNPEKEVIKMSCESFEHQAQNKRHLAETVEKLIAEARVRTHFFHLNKVDFSGRESMLTELLCTGPYRLVRGCTA